MNLNDLLEYAAQLNKTIIKAGSIGSEYEITRLSYRNRDSLVLAEIKGYEDFVIYTNILTRRNDIVKLLKASNLEEAYGIIEKSSQTRRQLETVNFSDYFVEVEADLSRIPFIKYYREDGGSYLTSSIYIACYENICNASYHRTMYLSRNKATLRVVPRHLNYIMSKYFEKNMNAPVALVLGLDPHHEIAAAMSPPLGVFEVEIGASLGGENKVVKTPIHRIPVPANAGVIIEGFISRDEKAREGPFTDILMLLDKERDQPVFVAEHVYISRKRPPVVHAIVPGLWEHQLLMGFPREAHIYTEVKRVAPCVKGVRLTEGGAMWLHCIISVGRECSEGDAKLAAIAAISAHPSVKHVLVVDDDIDLENSYSIEWAIATRLKGGEDIVVLKNIRGSTLEPRSRDGVGDKVVIIAIAPRSDQSYKYKRVEVP
ncbi:MAG: UbiD family decarboxylase [Desulfurococcaceae archaeon]